MALSLEAERAEYEQIPIPPTEAEWLALRAPWWGASIAACLFGEHEHITLGDACTEKLAGRKPETEEKQRLYARGHRWEAYVRDEIVETAGLKLTEPSVMHRRGPICSTPDATVLDRVDVGVEIKTAREFLGPVPKRQWWWQAQGKNWCEDTERVLIAALDSSLEVVYYEVERDDDAIKMMVDRAQAILDVLEWGEVPEWVELSAANVSRLWPQDSGEAVELDPEVVEWVKGYEEAHKALKQWQARKEHFRDLTVARMGAAAFASVGGERLVSYKSGQERSVLDWRRMAAENPDLAEKYTNTVPGTRTFRPSKSGLRKALERMEDGDDEAW